MEETHGAQVNMWVLKVTSSGWADATHAAGESHLICKMGRTTLPLSQGSCEDDIDATRKVLKRPSTAWLRG